jgi:HD-GYP domain-containing protein (c-di-GMP phosphodiesterase class II)
MSPRFGRGRRTQKDEQLLAATVDALAETLGLRDRGSEHSERVTELSLRVGDQLALGVGELRDLAFAARLHDIGKVGVPDAVLHKPGSLDDSERELMEGHAVEGAELIARIPGLAGAARIVRHHHERFDGEGYPDGLEGRDIPLASRILAVADAYAAMTEDRPYRRALPRFEIDREFRDCSGSQFDPYIVEALRRVVAAPER